MNRSNWLVPVLPLITAGLFCSQSPFEPSTDLGVPILSTVDPALAGLSQNFKSDSLNLDVISESSFVNRSRGVVSSVYDSTHYLTAASWHEEQSVIYVEFAVDSLAPLLRDTSLGIATVSLELRSVASLDTPVQSMSVGRSYHMKAAGSAFADQQGDIDLALGTARYEKQWLYLDIQPSEFSRMILRPGVSGTDSAGGQNAPDSIATDFALLVRSSADSLVRFYPCNSNSAAGSRPTLRVVCTVPNTSDTGSTMDTVAVAARASDYTVLESTPSQFDALPVASAGAGRVAIVKLDMSPFWAATHDSATGLTFRNVLAAEIGVSIDTVELRNTVLGHIDVFYDLYGAPVTAVDTSAMSRLRLTVDTTGAWFERDSLKLGHINHLLDAKSPSSTAYLHVALNRNVGFGRLRLRQAGNAPLKAVFSDPQ